MVPSCTKVNRSSAGVRLNPQPSRLQSFTESSEENSAGAFIRLVVHCCTLSGVRASESVVQTQFRRALWSVRVGSLRGKASQKGPSDPPREPALSDSHRLAG